MKKLIQFFLFFSLICSSFSALAVVSPTPTGFQSMDIQEFLELDGQSLAPHLGQKAKFRDKVVLKMTQIQVKRLLRKGKQINIEERLLANNRNFNIGGFLLGFFLSLLGVLIAILFGRNAVRSALLGFLVSLIIGLFGWLVF